MRVFRLSVSLLVALAAAGCGVTSLPVARSAVSPDAAADAARARGAMPAGAVIYGVAPMMFGDPPLQSVTAKLDGLKDLGVDALWLAPICETDDKGGISYSITNYKALRKDFGTMADLKALVAGAHQRGIKVLLDFVPNHTSNRHPYFKDAQAKGASSAYYDYYVRDAKGTPQHYFDWSNLMNLNYDNPSVQSFMTDALTYWVREADVDGYRLDAAWGVKDRTPTYWPQANKVLRTLKPGLFTLAEGTARDPYYVKNGFDAAYDWTTELGHGAWEHAFDDPAKTGDALRTALSSHETPADHVARFLANNDTGDRFITRHGDAVQKVAAALLLTLPGYPVVYNGDEVGAEFNPNDDPPCFTWDDPHHLRPLYKALTRLRHQLPALSHGALTEVPVTNAPGVYAFVRDAGHGDVALVVLNFGAAATATLTLPASVTTLAQQGKLVDALGSPSPPPATGNVLAVSLPATRALVMVPVDGGAVTRR